MFMPKKLLLISGSLISFLSVQDTAFASNTLTEESHSSASSSALVQIDAFVKAENSIQEYDRKDLNKDGKVDIKDAFEFIRQKLEKMFIRIFDSTGDGKIDLNDLKAFLDFNGNGKLDLGDISAGADKINSDVKKIMKGAEIALNAFKKVREIITSNALFDSLPEDKKGPILGLVNIAIEGSEAIIKGGKMLDEFKSKFLSHLKDFRDQLKSGNIDKKQLSGIKDILLDFLKIADKWEATGNSSKWISEIKKRLK